MSATSTASDYIKPEINNDDSSDPLRFSGFHGLPSDKEAFAVTSQFEHQQEDIIISNLDDIDMKLEPQSPPPAKYYIKRELLGHSGVYDEVTNVWSWEVDSDTVASERSLACPGKPNLSEESNILNIDIKEETLSVTYDADGNDLVDEDKYEFSGRTFHDIKSKNLGNVAANTVIIEGKVQSVKNEDETNNYSPTSPSKADNTVSNDEISHGTNNTDENNIIKEEHDLERFKTEEPLNTQPFRCSVCDFSTDYKKNLTVHLRIHADRKPWRCNICGFRAVRKRILKNHMRTHTSEKPFRCNVCEFSTAYKQNLTIHLRIHADEKPFSCSVCEYNTVQKRNLIIHMRTHTGEKPFRCKICDVRLTCQGSLEKHIRIHTGDKPLRCSVCDFSTAYKKSLTLHLQRHADEKPFRCNVCHYTTVQRRILDNHMRTHTGEKPFRCNVCKLRLTSKGSLDRHMLTHTGEKPFQCKICDYSGVQKQNLINHMRTHTGEKPYRCNICEYTTAQKGNLTRHMQKHC